MANKRNKWGDRPRKNAVISSKLVEPLFYWLQNHGHNSKLLQNTEKESLMAKLEWAVTKPDDLHRRLSLVIMQLFSPEEWGHLKKEFYRYRQYGEGQRKTLTVSTFVYEELAKLKEQLGYDTFDEVIERLIEDTH